MSHQIHVIVSDAQRSSLIAESQRTGAPIAELLRRAIDGYFEAHKQNGEVLRAAVRKAREPARR